MSKGFTEEAPIFSSKAFIDYLLTKKNELGVNKIQNSVFRFLYILVKYCITYINFSNKNKKQSILNKRYVGVKKLKLSRKID